MKHKCSICNKGFTRKYNRDKHLKEHHSDKEPVHKNKFSCLFCQQKGINKHYEEKRLLVKHVDRKHLNSLNYEFKRSAFNGKICLFSKKLITLQPLENFISDQQNLNEIFQVIAHQLTKFSVLKASLIVTADYRIPSIKQDWLQGV